MNQATGPTLVEYEGDLVDGVKEGIGLAVFSYDVGGVVLSKYYGGWSQDKRHGKGKIIIDND